MGRFYRNQCGSAAVIVALGATVLAGVTAFAVDLSYAQLVKGRLQNAADAAALAVAQSLPSSAQEETAARALALSMAQANAEASDGTVSQDADVAFGRYNSQSKQFEEGKKPYDSVRVVARRADSANNAVPTFFGGLFGVRSLDLSAVAIARNGEPRPCLYALDRASPSAVEAVGMAGLSGPNCAFQINSSSNNAAVTRGNGSITSARTCAVGGHSGSGFTPSPQSGCPALADPLAHVPEPAQPGPCFMSDFTITEDQVLPANRTYCGKANFAGNAEITLEPGLYYFKNAQLNISSASWSGEDVLIFLDANSSFHVSGNGVHQLTAAEDGPQAGIVIFQSRGANAPVNRKTGNSVLEVEGALYMPHATFDLSGTGSVHARPARVVPGVKGSGKGQGNTHYMDLVVAKRFHLHGDVGFQVGPPDGLQMVSRSMLVY